MKIFISPLVNVFTSCPGIHSHWTMDLFLIYIFGSLVISQESSGQIGVLTELSLAEYRPLHCPSALLPLVIHSITAALSDSCLSRSTSWPSIVSKLTNWFRNITKWKINLGCRQSPQTFFLLTVHISKGNNENFKIQEGAKGKFWTLNHWLLSNYGHRNGRQKLEEKMSG